MATAAFNDILGSTFNQLYRLGGLRTLTFRGRSLMVQCCVSAVIWFGPQDVAAWGVLGYGKYSEGNARLKCSNISTTTTGGAAAEGRGESYKDLYNDFLKMKGLMPNQVLECNKPNSSLYELSLV